ncbi:MAG: peptidoglycan-binding protein [Negativicutes bacterium]|nr:peptidoglycan-binding protein [Negativicutes bacterium]
MRKLLVFFFFTSFMWAYAASYAADQAIINGMESGDRSDFSKLYYHNRGTDWVYQEQQDVKKVQQRLKALGYDCGTADGTLGPRTEQAVRAFQRDLRLDVDGVIGPKTKRALLASTGR